MTSTEDGPRIVSGDVLEDHHGALARRADERSRAQHSRAIRPQIGQRRAADRTAFGERSIHRDGVGIGPPVPGIVESNRVGGGGDKPRTGREDPRPNPGPARQARRRKPGRGRPGGLPRPARPSPRATPTDPSKRRRRLLRRRLGPLKPARRHSATRCSDQSTDRGARSPALQPATVPEQRRRPLVLPRPEPRRGRCR